MECIKHQKTDNPEKNSNPISKKKKEFLKEGDKMLALMNGVLDNRSLKEKSASIQKKKKRDLKAADKSRQNEGQSGSSKKYEDNRPIV